MPKQKVKCANCGEKREIMRKHLTAKDYSFWCQNCCKEVAQDMRFRKKEDAKLTPKG